MIPKIMHQIWLGDAPLHPLMVAWHEKWKVLNPDWTVVLWRDDSSDSSSLRCDRFGNVPIDNALLNFVNQACHLSQRSNIWRYFIMHQFGGLYIDTDMEPLKPMMKLLSTGIWASDAFTAKRTGTSFPSISGGTTCLRYECAFFGAMPKHRWTVDLLANLGKRNPSETLSMGTEYFTEVTLLHPEVTILPAHLVLFQPPLDWTAYKREAHVPSSPDDNGRAGPATVAKHHWSSAWYPSGFKALKDPARSTT
jgi:hypothetical protein